MRTKLPGKSSVKSRSNRAAAAKLRSAKAAKARPSAKLTAKLVSIGNSRGVRLPKAVIEQAGLSESIAISVRGNKVILQSAEPENPRAGWEEQIKAALAEHGDDIDDWRDWQSIPNDFDEKEWTW